MNLYETLGRSAREWPGRPAVIEGDGVLSYDALWREIEALRLQLDRLDIGDGRGVAVMGRNGRAFIIAALAALGCGAVVLPLHPQLKPAELHEILAHAPLAAVISDGSAAPLPGGSHHELYLRDGTPLVVMKPASGSASPLVPWVPDAAFIRFSSGTTGAAKGVILTHDGIIDRVRAANAGLGLGPDDAVLWVLPMAYHFFVSIVLYLNVGAAVVVAPDHLAESIQAAAARHRATLLYAAPLQIRMLAGAGELLALPESLTRVMSVSSFLAPQTARDFHSRFGIPVSQGYGIIEVGLPIMNFQDAAAHPEAIGRPVPGFEAAILDDGLEPAAAGQTGQLALRGPGMFAGYLCPMQPRAQVLRDGYFLTGDLAHRDAGGLITIDGRSKSLISIAGHKVFPEEVAAVIERHPAVARSRIVMRPHPRFGEVVHADIQLHKAGGVDAEELLVFCRSRLSCHKVPASVSFVDEISLTPSGKVRYR